MHDANHDFLVISQSDISALSVRLKKTLDTQWEARIVSSGMQFMTPEMLEEVIDHTLLAFPDEDFNLVRAIFFFVVKDKLLIAPIQDEQGARNKLYTKLVHTLKPNELPEPYLSMTEAMALFKALIAPLFVGEQSEAKQNRLQREASRREQVNQWIADDEKMDGDLKKYLDFLVHIQRGHPLTEASLEAFKATLHDESRLPLASEASHSLSTLADTTIRHIKYHASTVFFEGIENKLVISKEERESVNALFDLIEASDHKKAEDFQKIERHLLEQHRLQLAREAKQIPAVLNQLFLQKITFEEALVKLIGAVSEPFEIIYKNNDLSAIHKAFNMTSLLVTQSLEALFDLITFAIKANLKLASYAIKKPAEALAAGGRMFFNVGEALFFLYRAAYEPDEKRKAVYQSKCYEKCSNLAYNARKCLEATIISVVVGFVIFANVATYGGVVPVLAGIHALTAIHALEVIHISDNVKTGQEYLDTLIEIAEVSVDSEKKHDQQALLHSVQGVVEESLRPLQQTVTPQKFESASQHIKEELMMLEGKLGDADEGEGESGREDVSEDDRLKLD
ncbi:MAG: hypothetical protein K0U37_00320 [Gammaproteobacteria bacterium]|nr:hypothetical protein [Gammaproteobacteria bacterium]